MDSEQFVFDLLAAANAITKRLDRSLSGIKGISFSEFQLLQALAASPGGAATRVDLAASVGLTPSGVTRALRPLEDLGFVVTHRDARDARRALASLTDAGHELHDDAAGVVADALADLDAVREIDEADARVLHRVLAGLSS
jgi:DNA-binding MarR family transcriptional regulator